MFEENPLGGGANGVESYDLRSMKRFCRFGSREIRFRLSILGVLAVVMTVWLGAFLYLYLFAIYVAINAFAILLLQQAPDQAPRRTYLFYSLVVTLPLYFVLTIGVLLWQSDAALMHILAVSLIFSCLFNMLTVRAVEPILFNWDVVAVILALMALIIVDAGRFGVGSRVLILSAVSVAIVIYFLNCAYAIVRFRQSLDVARQLELERGKVEALGRLTGGIAHDFNNLLTVILGNIELARLEENSDNKSAYLEEVQSAGERAARMTAQLLSFSRQAVLQPRDVDIGTLIDRAQGLVAGVLPKTVQVTYILPSEPLPQVMLDSGKFETVLLNLAMNSRDAMPDGGQLMIEAGIETPTLAQSKSIGLRPGRFLVVSVTDEGTGIPEQALAHVTDPFYTTKAFGEGSGLGLSMAKGFVEQTGGGLAIDSTEGEGTSVRLFIPLDKREQPKVGGS